MSGREGVSAIDSTRGPALLPSTALPGGLLINRGSARHWLLNLLDVLEPSGVFTALKAIVER
jgi:hypothetical protein